VGGRLTRAAVREELQAKVEDLSHQDRTRILVEVLWGVFGDMDRTDGCFVDFTRLPDADDLDLLVEFLRDEFCGDPSAVLVARLEGEADDSSLLDELVHDCKGAEAAGINNDGFSSQVEYLVKSMGYTEAEKAILAELAGEGADEKFDDEKLDDEDAPEEGG